MRPLIEILEDERTLMQRQEALVRYLLRHDDSELIDILASKKEIVDQDLEAVRDEIREYFGELFE